MWLWRCVVHQVCVLWLGVQVAVIAVIFFLIRFLCMRLAMEVGLEREMNCAWPLVHEMIDSEAEVNSDDNTQQNCNNSKTFLKFKLPSLSHTMFALPRSLITCHS